MGRIRRDRRSERGPLRLSGRRLLPHRPDQSCQSDNGRVQRDVRRPARNKAADRHAWISRNMYDFWWGYGWPTALTAIEVLIVVVPLLLVCAYYTYAERKVLAFSQLRKGPNVVGPFGLLQPIADALKMLMKETVVPSGANRLVFIAAPMVSLVLALVAWAVIPFDYGLVFPNINVGVFYLVAISSLSVYGIIMAAWASNSRYAFLGALRSAAQM